MGLNLNTSETRNYTRLNAVPSGSTSEPDYSVKYVAQSLTEEQQAQARANIGAAAAGETGGTSIKTYHVTDNSIDPTTDEVTINVDKLPESGDVLVLVWDAEVGNAVASGIIFTDGTDSIVLTIKNEGQGYGDEIYPAVGTAWTVRFEYNIEEGDVLGGGYVIGTSATQADWNETDTYSPAYIKNKPTIPSGGSYTNVLEDLPFSVVAYNVYFGSWDYNWVDYVINDGQLTDYTSQGGTNAVGGSIKSVCVFQAGHGNHYGTDNITNGIRIYPDSRTHNDIWIYLPKVEKGYGEGNTFDRVIKEFWGDEANIVIQGYNMSTNRYFRNINDCNSLVTYGYSGEDSSVPQLTKLTVWNKTNIGWNNFWYGRQNNARMGDVVLWDIPLTSDPYGGITRLPAPTRVIPFTLYMPKSRYAEFVAEMTTAWGQTAVDDYIVPQIQQYDFIVSEGYRYKMITLPTT